MGEGLLNLATLLGSPQEFFLHHLGEGVLPLVTLLGSSFSELLDSSKYWAQFHFMGEELLPNVTLLGSTFSELLDSSKSWTQLHIMMVGKSRGFGSGQEEGITWEAFTAGALQW